MSKRIILATLVALAIGSNAVLAADDSAQTQSQTTNDESVTVLYKDNPAVTTYEELNP